MIKRTIEISSGPACLSVKNDQLLVSRQGHTPATIPCEDLGIVIVDHPAVTYTHGALAALARFGAVLVVCGPNHHPASLLYPIEGNALHTERLRLQVEQSRPCAKRIWKQIVRAKIRAQAYLLGPRSDSSRKLLVLARAVRSGDPTNVEAQAAKIYWSALFPGAAFHRDPEGPPPNHLLNYGYMALRAAVARAIVAAGLHPSIGLHHRNRYNAFCLADDLIEPLRPLADAVVVTLWRAGRTELDRQAKADLLEVLTRTVRCGDEQGPLLVALARMLGSLVRVLEGEDRTLEIPTACT